MIILNKKITLEELKNIETFMTFDEEDMVKGVVDIKKKILAVNSDMHSDLEKFLLEKGSFQGNLYGINIHFTEDSILPDDKIISEGLIEFDSIINAQRNRADAKETGNKDWARNGRTVMSPEKRKLIIEVVNKWVEI